MASKDRKLWEKAILVKLNNMKRHDVFTITKLPDGAEAIGCTWVFKERWAPSSDFLKHKARLCAQGFTQVKGVDYGET